MLCRYCGYTAGEVNSNMFRCARCGQFSESGPPPTPAAKTSTLTWVGTILLGLTFVIAIATGQC